MTNQQLKAHCEDVIANQFGHWEDWVVDMAKEALAALTQPASPALKLPWSEKTCRECGCKSLSWGFAIINKSTVQNGLLRISDVDGLFYLGCDECSETVAQVSPDEVVELLSALQQSINAPHTAPIEPICATGGAWVNVSERLPLEADGRRGCLTVLVSDGDSVGICDFMKGDAPKPWASFSSYGDVNGNDITHWMPLPAAPEAE